jgi:hypothetical protein
MLSISVKYQSFVTRLQKKYEVVRLESSLSFEAVFGIVDNLTIGEKRIGETYRKWKKIQYDFFSVKIKKLRNVRSEVPWYNSKFDSTGCVKPTTRTEITHGCFHL